MGQAASHLLYLWSLLFRDLMPITGTNVTGIRLYL